MTDLDAAAKLPVRISRRLPINRNDPDYPTTFMSRISGSCCSGIPTTSHLRAPTATAGWVVDCDLHGLCWPSQQDVHSEEVHRLRERVRDLGEQTTADKLAQVRRLLAEISEEAGPALQQLAADRSVGAAR